MEFVKSTLPWSGDPVRRSDELHACLAECLGDWLRYLPTSITLFVDLEVGFGAVESLRAGLIGQMQIEFARRAKRKQRFVDLGLLSEGGVESFLTTRTHVQPWAIYYSKAGGLGGTEETVEAGVARGVIPCSSMRNHGVAWELTEDGKVQTWLATSRRENGEWDWESDIGHESAHAAFAQVPLFVQSNPRVPDNLLSTAKSPDQLTPLHIAQIIYLWSELAVVSIRGETRATTTGLPVPSPDELQALLRFSALVSGDSRFHEAAAMCAAADGVIDVNHGDEIFIIAAPILRALPHVTRFVNERQPPTLAMLQDALSVAH